MSRKGCLLIVMAFAVLTTITWLYDVYSEGLASFQSIAVQEPFVFAGVGRRVVVFDVSKPSRPRLVGRSEPLPEAVVDLAIKDGFVLAAIGRGDLQVVDVTDPSWPRVVSPVEITPYTLAIDIVGDHAYVVDGENLRVLDVTDPGAPRPITFVTPPSERPESSDLAWLAVSGNTAYLLDADQLHVVDIADPSRARLVSSTPRQPGLSAGAVNPDGMRAQGEQLILMLADRGMVILAVSDPAKPALAGRVAEVTHEDGSTSLSGGAVDVYRATAFAAALSPVLGSQLWHLVALQLADPEHPEQLALVPLQGDQMSPLWKIELSESGERAYIVDGAARLAIYDVSAPSNPVPLGAVKLQPTMAWRYQAEP